MECHSQPIISRGQRKEKKVKKEAAKGTHFTVFVAGPKRVGNRGRCQTWLMLL